jgi:hypothetical protein
MTHTYYCLCHAAIAAKMKEVGLAKFEIPSKVAVDDTIWTPETGLVTGVSYMS